MTARQAQLVFEPLAGWPYPDVEQTPSPFEARWATVTDGLLREAEHLGAALVVVELDVARHRIRQDGQLHQQAATASGRVRVSMDTRHGPMQWHCHRYTAPGRAWQHNVRAIVLTLQYLRRVDEIGASVAGQQYQGFLAIEAAPDTGEFASADGALRWLVRLGAELGGTHDDLTPATLLRRLRARFHPDSPHADTDRYERVDTAARLLQDGGLL